MDLKEATPLDEAIVPLLEAMAGRVLVVHLAEVERAFLGAALRRQGSGYLARFLTPTRWAACLLPREENRRRDSCRSDSWPATCGFRCTVNTTL